MLVCKDRVRFDQNLWHGHGTFVLYRYAIAKGEGGHSQGRGDMCWQCTKLYLITSLLLNKEALNVFCAEYHVIMSKTASEKRGKTLSSCMQMRITNVPIRRQQKTIARRRDYTIVIDYFKLEHMNNKILDIPMNT